MTAVADICLVVEASYPYVLGGVGAWTDNVIRALPHRRFHIVSLITSAQDRTRKFVLPENVQGMTDIVLDQSPPGCWRSLKYKGHVETVATLMRAVLTEGDGVTWAALMHELQRSGAGRRALLDSRRAWRAMEQAYLAMLPNAPLVDFFWTWRSLVRSILAIAATPLPDAKVYHAVSTGYAGLVGAHAKCLNERPLIVTEHGIYTNERRIELSVADWIYESGAGGFDVEGHTPELRNLWLTAFANFSRIAYDVADSITTLYRGNQLYQIQDGALDLKLRIIPNGIDPRPLAGIIPSADPRRPTVLLIGRLVPIKDIRTFILAAGILRQMVPGVEAIVIGPDDEDPGYAAECKALVEQQGLQDVVRFAGRVNVKNVKDYFERVDVIALTSISEAQPLVLLEAGAAGIPAVATDVGSCREILEGASDEPNSEPGGFVVRTCDPQATAEALAKLLLNRPLRDRMGNAMRNRVNALYNERRSIQMYDELYASLLGEDTRAMSDAA